jgi:hypothetical protein
MEKKDHLVIWVNRDFLDTLDLLEARGMKAMLEEMAEQVIMNMQGVKLNVTFI